jgi:hypothetical protein
MPSGRRHELMDTKMRNKSGQGNAAARVRRFTILQGGEGQLANRGFQFLRVSGIM